jgi:1-acyl-sn-glycerol-3-phosphate acyltransferase
MLVRSLFFHLAAYVNFLLQAVLFLPLLALKEDRVWPFARFWVRSTLWLHRATCGVDDEIRGVENIPSGGFLVAAKHQSAWETLRLVELFPRPAFILKRQLLWMPIFGWFLAKFGMVPVDRGKGSEAIAAMTERARRAIAEGRQIIIFPEGTRRPPLAPAAYRQGLARLYAALGTPCLPIALNSGLFWPRRSFVHRPGTILMQILPPIPPGLDPDAFARRVEATIEAASESLVEEAFRSQPELRAVVLAESIASDSPPP